MIEHEQMLAKEAELYEKMITINEILMLDEKIATHFEDNDKKSDVTEQVQHQHIHSKHVHIALKTSMLISWNSVLSMLESILDMQKYVNEVLKKVWKADLCLHVNDIELLDQLRAFLTPFKEFILLVSKCFPNLSLEPLIRSKIHVYVYVRCKLLNQQQISLLIVYLLKRSKYLLQKNWINIFQWHILQKLVSVLIL